MDDALLSLVVCPITHSKLVREGEWLVSTVGGVKYPVKEGLPVLLPDAAVLPAGYASVEAFKKAQGKGAAS